MGLHRTDLPAEAVEADEIAMPMLKGATSKGKN